MGRVIRKYITTSNNSSEPTCGWMVRGTVVSSAHQGLNSDARIYSYIYFRIFGDAHSVGGDVPVDDEAPTVTS